MGSPFRTWILLPIAVAVAGIAVVASPQSSAEGSHYYLRFPWQYGSQAAIATGYDSPPSHIGHDSKALDFRIQGGSTQTTVRAAAYGVVVERALNLNCNRQS